MRQPTLKLLIGWEEQSWSPGLSRDMSKPRLAFLPWQLLDASLQRQIGSSFLDSSSVGLSSHQDPGVGLLTLTSNSEADGETLLRTYWTRKCPTGLFAEK